RTVSGPTGALLSETGVSPPNPPLRADILSHRRSARRGRHDWCRKTTLCFSIHLAKSRHCLRRYRSPGLGEKELKCPPVTRVSAPGDPLSSSELADDPGRSRLPDAQRGGKGRGATPGIPGDEEERTDVDGGGVKITSGAPINGGEEPVAGQGQASIFARHWFTGESVGSCVNQMQTHPVLTSCSGADDHQVGPSACRSDWCPSSPGRPSRTLAWSRGCTS
ncbi:MAG: hypothetical protein ACI8RZ_000728, partial [Myxococcota bacterium]